MLAIYMVDPIIHACGRTPAFAAMQEDLLVLARNAWPRMISRKKAIVAARVPITVQPDSSSHGPGSASSASFAIQLSGGDTEDVSLCRTVADADGREDDIGVAGSSVQKAKQRVTGELEETRACCDENAGGTKLSRNTVLSARVPRPVCYLPATGFSCIGK
jgi:hypothetical protein